MKFADEWLPAKPGTDAALAMAMGHVVLKEFFVDRQTPYFTDYVKTYTDLPHLVRLEETGDGEYTAGKFLTAADLAEHARRGERRLQDRPDRRADRRARWCRTARWATGTATPASAGGTSSSATSTRSSRCSTPPRSRSWSGCRASTPPTARPPTSRAAYRRDASADTWSPRSSTCCSPSTASPARSAGSGCRGSGQQGYDDADSPYTPAWQETITGVPAATAARIGREFAANAEESHGRSMIVMGAGTNHWFHSDTIYRAFLTLTNLTGCQGVNGGGWAHYVGQEKVRPITGYTQIANALDWNRPAAQHDPDRVLVPAHQPVPLRPVRRRHALRHHRPGAARREVHRRRDRPERPDGLDAVVPDLRPQPARPQRRRGRGRASRWASTSSSSSSPAASTSPARTRTRPATTRASCRSGGPTCSAPRARATSTSSSTSSAPTPRSAPPRRPKANARSTCDGATRHPRGSSTC